MVSFLFWNLAKRSLQHRVARLAAAHEVDVVMLAECAVEPVDLLEALNATGQGTYSCPSPDTDKVRLFTRFPESALVNAFNSQLGETSIWWLQAGASTDLILALVHFGSRVNWDRDDQTLQATVLADDVLRVEDDLGHRRTVLVGDLNMNPFDPGVAGAAALHAVMTRDLARRQEREVKGRPYCFFYNPMWGFFGDRTPGPPGTYYLRASKPLNYYWNMYDQLLLRPDLMDLLEDLRVLDTDSHEPLVTAHGLPSKSEGSDHLPLLFRLDL